MFERHLFHFINILVRHAIGVKIVGQKADTCFFADALELGINLCSRHIVIELPLVVVAVMSPKLCNIGKSLYLIFKIQHISGAISTDRMITNIQCVSVNHALA